MKNALLLFSVFCLPAICSAKDARHDTIKLDKCYWSTGLNAGIISSAIIWTSYNSPSGLTTVYNTLGGVRFSAALHAGMLWHYNFNRHIGAYTGLDLKNIGYTEDKPNFTRTIRTYNIGVPLAVKIGDMRWHGSYGFAGCGIDLAVNFKEKQVTEDKKKTKTNEWFSNRGQLVMPYFFCGINIKGVSIKAQYYPTNFLNPNYSITNSTGTIKPYDGTTVHLFFLTVGFPFLLEDFKRLKDMPIS